MYYNKNLAVLGVLTIVFSITANAQYREREKQIPTKLESRHRKPKNPVVIGIVEKAMGPSRCYRGSGSRTSVTLGMRVFERDRLVTEQSRIHVRYKDGTYLEIGEDSTFEAERIRFKPEQSLPFTRSGDQYDETVFRFEHGLVRITAAEVGEFEHFVIKADMAVIKVSAPSDFYLIKLSGEKDLAVKVMRGKVEVINEVTNEAMQVPPETGAYVKTSGVVNPSGAFNLDQVRFFKSRTAL